MRKIFTLLSLLLATITVSAATNYGNITLKSSAEIQAIAEQVQTQNTYGTVTVGGGFTLSDADLAVLKDLVVKNDVNMLDLTDAQFADNRIPDYAFSPATATSDNAAVRKLIGITFPKSVTAIGTKAFYRQGKLQRFVFPEGCLLETIGERAFQDCNNVAGTDVAADIVIPASVVTIGGNAFRACKCNSVTVAKGSKLSRISDEAFHNCGMKTFILDESNTAMTIGNSAFGGTTKLTTLKVLRTVVPTLNEKGSFADHSAELTVPEAQKDDYMADAEWAQFTNVKTQVVDAIGTVSAEAAQQGGTVYNMAGQRVDAHAKGLVIKGAKKVYIK